MISSIKVQGSLPLKLTMPLRESTPKEFAPFLGPDNCVLMEY